MTIDPINDVDGRRSPPADHSNTLLDPVSYNNAVTWLRDYLFSSRVIEELS